MTEGLNPRDEAFVQNALKLTDARVRLDERIVLWFWRFSIVFLVFTLVLYVFFEPRDRFLGIRVGGAGDEVSSILLGALVFASSSIGMVMNRVTRIIRALSRSHEPGARGP